MWQASRTGSARSSLMWRMRKFRNLTFENVILGKTDANNTNYMGIFGEPLYIHITSVYNQDNSNDLTSWYAL